MKRLICLFLLGAMLLGGCAAESSGGIAATTGPVYEFAARICEGTGLEVTLVVTDSVSCLHDYSLSVRQVKAVESADVVVLSGAGLEDFMSDLLSGAGSCIDASAGISLLSGEDGDDPHIWLSVPNAIAMAENIYTSLARLYPDYSARMAENYAALLAELQALDEYGREALANLRCREIITFHDGFQYLAAEYGLTVLAAVEEESGSEASAAELKELVTLVQEHSLSAVFTETNGSTAAAQAISAETGVEIYTLDMALSSGSYFSSMTQNFDTLKEALG